MASPRAATIGECMLELSSTGALGAGRSVQMGFGGDTLNTAVYMARLGVATDFVTALGDDHYSDWMLASWRAEGVGTALIPRQAARLPGLYMIETDDTGERYFHYWRSEAPARNLFDDPQQVASLQEELSQHQLVYFSGITLSLYGESGRARCFDMLAALRESGVQLAFDGNYRPRGWPDAEVARAAFSRACELSHIVLPTFDDEQALFGDATPADTVQRITAHGVAELVLKRGAAGCDVVFDGNQVTVSTEAVAVPLDTTAAGDSFNAGYLAGRLRGLSPEQAAGWGHRLAGQVIQVKGAIMPREQMPAF